MLQTSFLKKIPLIQVYRNKLAKLGRTQSAYLLQNYPPSSQPDYYPPHQEHHQQQGYYPNPSGGRHAQHEDWSNGYPDQQGDYPAELSYNYSKANGQNSAFNSGRYPAQIRQQQQQQYQQQFAAAGSRYIDQLNAQQQHYYWNLGFAKCGKTLKMLIVRWS